MSTLHVFLSPGTLCHGLLLLRREQERLRLEAETADSDDSFMGVLDYKYGSTGLNSKGQVCNGRSVIICDARCVADARPL